MELTRFTPTSVEITRNDSGEQITGYAAVWFNGTPETEYNTGEYIERIDPAAFNDSLLGGEAIESRFNHDRNFVLGRSDLGTVIFRTDKKGLHFAIPYDATDPDHVKVRRKIEKGLITGGSFHGFANRENSEIKRENGNVIVTLKRIDLREAGPVDKPAYKGTTSEVNRWLELKRWLEEYDLAERSKAADEIIKRYS